MKKRLNKKRKPTQTVAQDARPDARSDGPKDAHKDAPSSRTNGSRSGRASDAATTPRPAPARAHAPAREPQATATEDFPVVGVGASAGGLEAFSQLLSQLPPKTGMAFVLVQHLDPTHTSALEEILSRTTRIPVREVTDGLRVERDHVYVIPANADMVITDGALQLARRTAARGMHKPIDAFFQSLASARGDRAIGVILSGTASDGAGGCQYIKGTGGITFAQDPSTAKYDSMPQSAIAAGCIDFVMAPAAIAEELVRIGKHPYIARPSSPLVESGGTVPEDELQQLFKLIFDAKGVDFTHYKKTTLHRRIKRRMIVNGIEKFDEYVRFAGDNPAEVESLYRDVLIHVTGFFREQGAFEALRKEVFPKLFEDRKTGSDPVRVWVPGCSTGEEAYSLAMALMEYVWFDRPGGPPASTGIQIFATDVSEEVLDHARGGIYGEPAMANVSPARLKRFFQKHSGGYQVNKSIREVCVFARHNVIKDPPFSKLDLVSCQNLLIYLEPDLQRRVIPALHYGLKPNGYLVVGGAEGLGIFTDCFIPIDKKFKIYQKKQTATRLITYATGGDYVPRKPERAKPAITAMPGFSGIEKEADRVLLSRFAPASIVVNSDWEIVHFRGKTGAYLEPATGNPAFSLSKMVREGLLLDLRAALQEAKKKNITVRKEGIALSSDTGMRNVNLEVIPIEGPNARERLYVVAFEDGPQQTTRQEQSKARRAHARGRRDALAQENERLTRQVRQLREQLRSVIDDQETTSEEFKTANEEVLSANEELQSTNEELETAKEELQSSNEELTTVNEEMQNRNTELSVTNNDLLNLLGNVNVAVVMVGEDLRIRRFTPVSQKLLNLIPSDIGRRLGEIRPNVNVDNLEEIAHRALEGHELHEQQVCDNENTWYMMRARPYKTRDGKTDGAVISFQDIDAFKRRLDETKAYADAVIENAREAILVLDADLRVMLANQAFYGHFRVSPGETENRPVYELGNRQWDIPELRHLLEAIIKENGRIDNFEMRHRFEQLGDRVMLLNARLVGPHEGSSLIFLSIEDITEERKRSDALERQAALLDLARDAVIVRDLDGKIQYWNHGAERMYGWKKEEALGRESEELLQTVLPRPIEEIVEEVRRTGGWEGELRQVTHEGNTLFVRSWWALMEQASEPMVILQINSDVSVQKEYEENLRQVSGHLMRVQDEERRRIARELHDSTGQKLAAARMFLESVTKTTNPKSIDKRVLETVELIEGAFQDIRTLSQVLHPPLLDEAGLVSATRSMVDSFSQRAKIHVEFQVPEGFGRLPQPVELALFRVIQESLTNIHRHSGAKRAKVEIAQTPEQITLEVRDNGKGLPPNFRSDVKQVLGVGILGMKERLSQLGGLLKIESDKKGTVVRAVVPSRAPSTAAQPSTQTSAQTSPAQTSPAQD